MKAIPLLLASGLLINSQSLFAEPHPGEELHKAGNCMSCHTNKPYNPKKTNSFPKLVKAVNFCNDNLNAGMFDDEIHQLAEYLNDTYYHHPK